MTKEFSGIGTYLRKCRIKAGKTQLDVAIEVRISPQAVSNVERGITRPSATSLAKWAGLVGAKDERVVKELLQAYRARIRKSLELVQQSA